MLTFEMGRDREAIHLRHHDNRLPPSTNSFSNSLGHCDTCQPSQNKGFESVTTFVTRGSRLLQTPCPAPSPRISDNEVCATYLVSIGVDALTCFAWLGEIYVLISLACHIELGSVVCWCFRGCSRVRHQDPMGRFRAA